ncbi:MAG: cytochrome-c oxidase, cbb3-type subunit III [Mangrovicoccus sp.]|nr:cytochrome-c oxidase, cbb3-type subunit III [Mangrovicoccus sp.]
MSKKTDANEVPTTGHSWDGIEEYDNPMPRWWLIVFYLCIIWGLGYTVFYPAWPMVNSATSGILGWSTRGQVADEIDAQLTANAAVTEKLATVELASIAENPELNQFAVNSGAAVFRTWCSQCHGSGAAGAVGFPNLLDDSWLWGGSLEEIHYTITNGIRNEVSEDAHYSEMPAFGDILEESEIVQVVNYVMSLSGDPQDAEAAAAGATIFEEQCTACHAEDGTGDKYQGAPNLTDAIWLYGGDYDTLLETVTYSRFGVMPPWKDEVGGRLSEAQVRAVAVYVHQLGGGQ